MALWHAVALCMNGWALGVSGESEKGLAQISQGVDRLGLAALQHILLALQAAEVGWRADPCPQLVGWR
jgi:hypothetical protein